MSTMKALLTFVGVLMMLVSTLYSQDDNICATVDSYTSTQHINSAINLKILPVQFSDVTCKKSGGILPKFTKTNFEEALGSNGIYASPLH